jgi:hypothetical protein
MNARISDVWVLGAVFALAGLVSCDDDEEPPACAPFVACGGAATGSWDVETLCVADTTAAQSFCPGSSFDLTGLTYTGGVNLETGGAYNLTLTTSGTARLSFAPSCFAQLGEGLTCATINLFLAGLLVQGGEAVPFSSASCSGTELCACDLVLKPFTQTTAGTYTTAGVQLTTTPAGGVPSQTDYCAQGRRLKVAWSGAAPDTTTEPPGTPALPRPQDFVPTGTLVFRKK